MNRILSIIEKYKSKGPKFQIRKLEEDIELIKEDLHVQADFFFLKNRFLFFII